MLFIIIPSILFFLAVGSHRSTFHGLRGHWKAPGYRMPDVDNTLSKSGECQLGENRICSTSTRINVDGPLGKWWRRRALIFLVVAWCGRHIDPAGSHSRSATLWIPDQEPLRWKKDSSPLQYVGKILIFSCADGGTTEGFLQSTHVLLDGLPIGWCGDKPKGPGDFVGLGEKQTNCDWPIYYCQRR